MKPPDRSVSAPAPPAMSELHVAVIGALMVMIGPISLALYTPAMPALVAAFGTSIGAVKMTLTVFFLGFALSQLACGPLSDAFGRRPVAIGFFAVYLVGSAAAMLAPDMGWLLLGRALQGIGCAAGIAISRAIVRDQYAGQASARIMNLIGTMLAIGPAVSPTLGGLLLGLSGWHSIFIAMAVYGVVLLGLLVVMVPETNRAPSPSLAAPGAILASYRELLCDRGFMRAGLAVGGALGGIYTLSGLLPFVLIQQVGLSPAQFGLAMLMQTGSFLFGTLVTGRLLRRTSASALVPYGIALVMCGGLGFAVVLPFLPLTTPSVMLPVTLWAFGLAFIMPGCTTAALAGFAHIAGAASALVGFMQIGGGFVGTTLSALFPSPYSALTLLVPLLAAAAAAAHLLLRPRTRAAAPEAPGVAPMDATDLELAADPLGVVGAAGEEIETETFSRSA